MKAILDSRLYAVAADANQPVQGELAAILDEVAAHISRYVVLTGDQLVAVTLWAAHTHVLDAADITPYISISSPEKQSGKSVLLDVLDGLVHAPWRAVRPSEAVVYRKVEKDEPTLLLDEVDTIWGPRAKQEDEGLRALLNAGFRRYGSTVPRCVGASLKLKDFATFCPKALAGIGDLPDTVADRSIPIRMARKRRSDHVERFRQRTVTPLADELRNDLHEALVALVAVLREAEPTLPDELSDRGQDAWEPLLAIADHAGTTWASQARESAIRIMATRPEPVPIAIRLLGDARDVFLKGFVANIDTPTLIEELSRIDDAPWGDWNGKPITPRRLANLLRPYNITPDKNHDWRGYHKRDFEDTWERYLPASQESATTATLATNT